MPDSEKTATKLKVALIGLGRIGSSNDSGKINQNPRAHAGALFSHSNFSLVAAFDSSLQARENFKNDWHTEIPVHANLADLKNYQPFDLVVVSVFTKNQGKVLKDIIAAKPKFILCEKPFCESLSEAQKIEKLLQKNHVPSLINFHRRAEPRFIDLKKRLTEMGLPIKVNIVYKKGLINYGSHIIDLLIYFFGDLKSVKAKKLAVLQTKSDDPSISGTLIFKNNLEVDVIGIDDVKYELFEMDIFYPDNKITLELGGYSIFQRTSVIGEHYENYTSLSKPNYLYKPGPVAGLKELYENIALIITKQNNIKASLTTSKEAIKIWRVITALKKSSLTGRSINL